MVQEDQDLMSRDAVLDTIQVSRISHINTSDITWCMENVMSAFGTMTENSCLITF